MTIKKILSLLICLISLKSFAYDHSYDVYGEWNGEGHISGETEDGVPIELDTN